MKTRRRIADVHCHLHDYPDNEVSIIGGLGLEIIAVSDDYRSSLRTLSIADRRQWVIPAVGIHPWNVNAGSLKEVDMIKYLVYRSKNRVRVLGEVGLDKKFKPETYENQLQVFREFIALATDVKAVLNVHAAGAWNDIVDMLLRSDVPSAIVHWYTGPLELVKKLKDRGFFISINPAVAIQQKHREIASLAPLDIVLVESDGPYKYRGLTMHPRNVFDVIKVIAEARNMKLEEVCEVVSHNYERLKKFLT
uniref:TatD family deoxyribonuclease n=1 Tax=Ignisphaera aggregans TaxID=334771 RepID=A0A7C2VDB8_9CREN